EIYNLSRISPWFLQQMEQIVDLENKLKGDDNPLQDSDMSGLYYIHANLPQ
ncbi:MAG: hypothetical protein F6K47_43595, partial [Symploca sp. SIO2E6]|nr:hypothetical protein [Symploca sp. SIO2E6]